MTNTKITYISALETAIACEALDIEVREKLTALRDAQLKRTKTKSAKPTARQTENAGIKNTILEMMEADKGYTITDLIKSVPAIADFSNQRVTAIVRQMEHDDHTLRREEIKRKAYFFIADGEVED